MTMVRSAVRIKYNEDEDGDEEDAGGDDGSGDRTDGEGGHEGG